METDCAEERHPMSEYASSAVRCAEYIDDRYMRGTSISSNRLPRPDTIRKFCTVTPAPKTKSCNYSAELKEAAVAYILAGHSQIETAQHFGVTRTTLYKWCAPRGIIFEKGNWPQPKMRAI